MSYYRNQDPYSDICIVSNDGIKYYYSRFMIHKSTCKYLKSLLLGPLRNGDDCISVNISSGLLEYIISYINTDEIIDISNKTFGELVEFCQMACWYHPLNDDFINIHIHNYEQYYTAIINMYPAIFTSTGILGSTINEWIRNADLTGIDPKLFRYYNRNCNIYLLNNYTEVNSPDDNAAAIKYFLDRFEIGHHDGVIMLKILSRITDPYLLADCIKMIKYISNGS